MKTIKQLLITIAVLLCSATMYAYDFEVDGIYYNITSATDFTAEVTNGDYCMVDVIIPSTVSYNGEIYTVASIGEEAFFGCTDLISIEIPNSVTFIENGAFNECSSLTSIYIPNSVISIGNYTFNNCTSLKELYIEDGDTTLELGYSSEYDKYGLFYDCSLEILYIGRNLGYDATDPRAYNSPFSEQEKLKTITISNRVTFIGEELFSFCSSLKTIEIPNSVTTIGNGAFCRCDSLTSIEIPSSVTSVQTNYDDHDPIYGAFERCSNLKTVTFGEDSQLTSIGVKTFYGCSSLTGIEIPNNVTSIKGGAFMDCDSLTSIEIPNSVISIDYYSSYDNFGAFKGCSNLKTVTFGENSQLTSIGERAFMYCSSLTSIEIPNSVISIGYQVFDGCSNLTTVIFGENSQLTSIGWDAFYHCSNLTSIEIPSCVTSIEYNAFEGCTSLKNLRIDDGYSTLELEYDLFNNCPLDAIYLGRNLSFESSESSENLPFYNMRTLKTLTIGSYVSEILGKTFYDCSNLESIYMTSVPPIIAEDTFSNTSYYLTILYVPKGTLAFYQAANIWKNFWNIQEYEPTSIEDIETEETNFTISSNGISFTNANNSTVAIYSINGVLVKRIDKYTGEEITLDKGIYIVCVGDKAMKIIL